MIDEQQHDALQRSKLTIRLCLVFFVCVCAVRFASASRTPCVPAMSRTNYYVAVNTR